MIAGKAGTDRRVVPYIALSIATANTRTRIVTFVVTARLVQGTIAVNNTLRLALSVRISVM